MLDIKTKQILKQNLNLAIRFPGNEQRKVQSRRDPKTCKERVIPEEDMQQQH